MSSTLTRILLVIGSTGGAIVGAFIAITKLVPERAKVIIGYQVEAIEGMQNEIKRLVELVAYLEKELQEMREKLEENGEEIHYHI